MNVPQHNGANTSSQPPQEGVLDLAGLLRQAAKVHQGCMKFSSDGIAKLMGLIKTRAQQELDVGDGLKVETVRVERRLDGSVTVFFGI